MQWYHLINFLATAEIIIGGSIFYTFSMWYRRNNINGESIFSAATNFYEYVNMLLNRRSFMNLHLEKFQHRRQESRFLGMFHYAQPVLSIRDPELIQQMFVHDMHCFAARHKFMPSGIDELCDANLFVLESGRWRNIRSKLAPIFRQSNMEKMFPLMRQTAMHYAEHLDVNNMTEFQTKNIFRKYGTDFITNVVLGIENDSTSENNEFYKMANELTTNGFMRYWHNTIAQLCPLGVKEFDSGVYDFFRKAIQKEITSRKENRRKEDRSDVLNCILKANRGDEGIEDETDQGGDRERDIVDSYAAAKELKPHEDEKDLPEYQNAERELSEVEIAAQVLLFFMSSHETVAKALSFLCYELSRHYRIQEKLKKEIDDVTTRYLDIALVPYEAICAMEYLDQVVCESLRKWPGSVFTDRKVVHSYAIPKTATSIENYPYEPDLRLEPGDVVVIPIYAIHRSPDFFPEPNVFDPSRFNRENRAKIHPYTFMPFGVGGRNCIGSRFALIQIKTITVHLLAKFRLHMVRNTCLNLAKGYNNLDSEDGIWLGLEKRVSP